MRQLRVTWAQVAGPAGSLRHETLGAALRGAVRPALEHGPLSIAPAVWFADESELLAWLARDAIAGLLSERWWWRALLHCDTDRAAAVRHWTASARAVPRAAERLEAMGVGAAWFESWTSPGRQGLLTALAQHYPLIAVVQRFVEAGVTPGAIPRRVAAKPPTGESSNHQHAGQGDSPAHGPPAPPASVRSAPPASVRSAPARLHHLCLKLARDPACAFDERYVERELLRESLTGANDPILFGVVASPPSAPAAGDARTAWVVEMPRATTTRSRGDAQIARDARRGPTVAAPPRVGTTARDVEPADTVRDTAAHETGADPASAIPPIDAESGAAVASLALDHGTVFRTGHGGLFFVLNAALQLGLYGDCSQPLHRGLDMSPWRFLYQTGVTFGGRRFARDPLAEWLDVSRVPIRNVHRLPPPRPGASSATGCVRSMATGGRCRLCCSRGV